MRRALAAFAAMLLLHSSALQAGVLCERTQAANRVAFPAADVAREAGHSHHAAPPSAPPNAPPERGDQSHNSPVHCALMAGCGVASLAAAPGTQAVPPAVDVTVAPATRQLAPHSFSAAPEPPPPKV